MIKKYFVFVFALAVSGAFGQSTDWLQGNFKEKSNLEITEDSNFILSNGIVSRTFSTAPNGATISYFNLVTGESVMRSVRPEALVEINGISFEVGGLTGQPIQNYLKKSWISEMKSNPASFKYQGYQTNGDKRKGAVCISFFRQY